MSPPQKHPALPVHHSVHWTPHIALWILLLQNPFVGLLQCATVQKVCTAVGFASQVLCDSSTRTYHHTLRWHNTIKCYKQESLKYQEIHVQVGAQVKAGSWSNFPWRLVPTPRGIPETLRSLLAVHVRKCFSASAVCLWGGRGEESEKRPSRGTLPHFWTEVAGCRTGIHWAWVDEAIAAYNEDLGVWWCT